MLYSLLPVENTRDSNNVMVHEPMNLLQNNASIDHHD